ncbi:MAG: hypothetical protein LAT82_00905 [Nanoarchaeota archaeon]|nr:hypothetical protein [Nanoarchaeota archaeon]
MNILSRNYQKEKNNEIFNKKINLENKQEKFKRLAEKRVSKILEELRILSNLSNKVIYEFNEEQIDAIFSRLEEELMVIKSKFKVYNRNQKFKL